MTNEYINTILSGLRHCGSDEFCDNCPAEKLCATKPGEHICNRAAEIIEELRRKHGRWEPVRHGSGDDTPNAVSLDVQYVIGALKNALVQTTAQTAGRGWIRR